MVTGALKKNKRMRMNGRYIENRIKVLSGDEITFDRIYSKYKAGCLVVLENYAKNDKVLVSNIDQKEKTLCVAYYDGFSNKGIHREVLQFGDNTKIPNNCYKAMDFGILYNNSQMYKELNEKLQMVN